MMGNLELCGRQIYPASEHDPEPVCVMHSPDPHKSEKEFRAEFECISVENKYLMTTSA
jgi:hypothetical protein